MSLDDLLKSTLRKYDTLGAPGPTLPWAEDDYGSWARMLAGTNQIVAMVDTYPDDMGGGYFYCVGDGPAEESSEDRFETAEAAREAADKRLVEMGYTFVGTN